MANFKATWKIRVDEKTKAPVIRVEYHSDAPPGEHEKIHAALAAKAEALLREYFGADAQLEHSRFECIDIGSRAESAPPVPVDPTPQSNSGGGLSR